MKSTTLSGVESTPRGGVNRRSSLKTCAQNSVRGCLADSPLGVSAGHFQHPLGGLGNGMQYFER
jgi:hypothetical protein